MSCGRVCVCVLIVQQTNMFLPVVVQLCVSGLRIWISIIHIITGIGILGEDTNL